VMLRGVTDPSRLLDLVENFTIFSEHKSGYVKILAQNHQFLGVNNAIVSMLQARGAGHGRAGVFWQTQGSGKSLSMVFFAQKVLRRVTGNWTFVVVTDRAELDDQIARTFKETGAVSEADSKMSHAGSGAHLRQLLTENHRYVFTLIQKFQAADQLSDRRDIVVLTDEAHRSQYDTLALNMRSALPNALFIAFTGTPLIAGEERTRDVFGDYVSIYDFQQSVEDGATVRLFYENRTPELRLKNPNFNDDMYAVIEAADLDEAQEQRLERELGRQYHLITRDDRLDDMERPTCACRARITLRVLQGSQRRAAYKEVGHDAVYYHHCVRSARRNDRGGGVTSAAADTSAAFVELGHGHGVALRRPAGAVRGPAVLLRSRSVRV